MNQDDITRLRQEADVAGRVRPPMVVDLLALVDKLQRAGEFGIARELLGKVRPVLPAATPQAERVRLAQAHALCTYKDNYLHAGDRYKGALTILESIGLRGPTCKDKETLGQAGAIYKRLWEATGQLDHLYSALDFYRLAWQRDPEHDLGWGGVMAAYVLDLLAFREFCSATQAGRPTDRADALRAEALAWRQALRVDLPARLAAAGQADSYWGLASLAEVAFGLGDYARAGELLDRARAASPAPWMLQSSARQLASIARLHRLPPASGAPGEPQHPAWVAIARVLGQQTLAVSENWRGKVGLALSGGGFRAALFHLGVLARLAECDVLRSVETLSTVSGGSIVGAHYYLELRQLLQTKPDEAITRNDYIALVQRVASATLAGVSHNLRVQALVDPIANLRMVFSSDYSRSKRIGELYARYFYAQVDDDLRGTEMRQMRQLCISPAASPSGDAGLAAGPDFKPASGNWLRRAKVPNLMLNTTSLNTGHNWHFTARWMGEPPGLTGDEIDVGERYRRVYYDDPTLAPDLQAFALAHAVAASSCVPALFEPLPLDNLYPDRTVRLVDGGVHDNQGMGALYNDECDFIFCSDASGQLESQPAPANGSLGTFFRSDAILQDRVREAQYAEARSQADNGALHGLFFIHLKQDLASAPIAPKGCTDPASDLAPSGCTPYGVDREIQRLLAQMRTDLDSFTEVEAYALMASGYLLTRHQLGALDAAYQRSGQPGRWGSYDIDAPMAMGADGNPAWAFVPLLELMQLPAGQGGERRADLARQCRTGAVMFGRVWLLVDGLRYGGLGIAGLAGAGLLYWLVQHWGQIYSYPLDLSVSSLSLAAVAALGGLVVSPMLKWLDPAGATRSAALGVVVALFGALASVVHLSIFEPLLRKRGSLARLLSLPK
ncbi:MAG: patatin-like phospholipase family protein [Burkholderiales bacterium]|nr:patatin-like phospholipase family protein [Burkholderiales bacterium]